MLFKAATGLAALLALFVYRSGRIAWNHILTAPDLPDAYYVGGNWTSHCSLIKDLTSNDINFCEDITFWDHHDANGTRTDRLVLGCDPNRKAWNTVMGPLRDPDPRGHLFLYVPRTDAVHRLPLAGYPAHHDFHPLGMEIYPSHDGAPSNLFIVNHARARTTVEQFVLDPARLAEGARYVRTLRSPYFVSPNAIALTSPTSFYVSNDHLLTRRLPSPIGHVAPLVETIAGLPLGWVAHVSIHASPADADAVTGADDYVLSHTVSALGIPFANGIALSPTRAHLAVASTSLGLVHFYAVNASSASSAPTLTHSHTVPLPFFADNIAYDDDSTLIVTGHPHFPSLVAVAANKTGARAPSWAVALAPLADTTRFASDGDARARAYDQRAPLSAAGFVPAVTTHEVETLFQSDGSVFGSSSTTLRDARTGAIYVAGLYEEGMLVCRP